MKQRIDTTGNDHDIASWIWRNLVPRKGQAATVQGELLRAVEKLRWEAQENGNVNWDEGFLILIDFLSETLCSSTVLSEQMRHALQADLSLLRSFQPASELDERSGSGSVPYVKDELYDRLAEAVVVFARANPEPLNRELNPELNR